MNKHKFVAKVFCFKGLFTTQGPVFGDTVAHPADYRYSQFHRKNDVQPSNGKKIPIICDAILVDQKFGTSVVKDIIDSHGAKQSSADMAEFSQRHQKLCYSDLELDAQLESLKKKLVEVGKESEMLLNQEIHELEM